MRTPFGRSDARMTRFQPLVSERWDVERRLCVTDYRILSSIVFASRNGLRWRDAPKGHGPAGSLGSRWKRWGDVGVFARMVDGLAAEAAVLKTAMIAATCLKAHRRATSLRSEKQARRPEGLRFRRRDHRGLAMGQGQVWNLGKPVPSGDLRVPFRTCP